MNQDKNFENICFRRPVTTKWYKQYSFIIEHLSSATGQNVIDLMGLSSMISMHDQIEDELKETIQKKSEEVLHLVEEQMK